MFTLTRIEETSKGTLGVLAWEGETLCWTLELPWRDNKPNISCIPAGHYPIVLEYSAKFDKLLWELKEVPGRSEVKIHRGNYLSDIEGCIMVGIDIGWDSKGNRRLFKSAEAFIRLMTKTDGVLLDRQETTIEILSSSFEKF